MEKRNAGNLNGVLESINGQPAGFRVQAYYDEHYFTNITVFDISPEYVELINQTEYCCAVIALDEGGFLSLFDILATHGSQQFFPKESNYILELSAAFSIRGAKPFYADAKFQEFRFEITDGHELLGLCPYDVNWDFAGIVRNKKLEIPIESPLISVNTTLGEFDFCSYPIRKFGKESLSFKFGHYIYFRTKHPIPPANFKHTFEKITALFALFCGELVTINGITLVESKQGRVDKHEFTGYCNYPRFQLRRLSDGNDSAAVRFSRLGVFKLTDFCDIETALNTWIELADISEFSLACKAYQRILLDEDVRIVTINKFLAAMQIVEGCHSAFYGSAEADAEFRARKSDIIAQLNSDDDKVFVKDYLFPSGYKFRKALKTYLLDGINLFLTAPLSSSQFEKNYGGLVEKIVNERNLYTHSSRLLTQTLNPLETVRIASICKVFFQAAVLKKLGLSAEVIKYRFSNNRSFVAYMETIFNISITAEIHIDGFDKAMWHFSEVSPT